MMIKTYSELSRLQTFEERFDYLVLGGVVGHSTFGRDRYLNQIFYNSYDWKLARDKVIIRDNACDLGVIGRDILDRIYVHHMNPITIEDFENNYGILIDPEFLICTSFRTHQAITFGDPKHIVKLPRERRKGDTLLW